MLLKSRIIKRGVLLIGIMLLGLFRIDAQDTFKVNGVVLSQSNKPLSNVSVSVEGSSLRPVITDQEGRFELEAPSGYEWLIIEPTGDYKEKRYYLAGDNDLKIYLTASDIPAGDDRVLLLARQERKRNIVGAYSELDVDRIHHTPAISLDEYMQGRVSGMNAIKRSGMPASGAVINLRGINSLNASNQPLYIVDGMPLTSHEIFGSNIHGYSYNPLVSINPHDISKTTVVKDAAITASYGSKGSNGIIFIETLDPSVTQTTIELDLRTGYSLRPERYIPQLDANAHKTLMNEVLFSSGMFEDEIKEQYPNLFLTKDDENYIDFQHNTDWQDIIYSDAIFTNLNLNLKGGDEIARYGLSFGYFNSNGIIKNTNYQSYNLRFVSRLNVFTWLKMNAGVSLNYNLNSLKEAATSEETSPILASLAKSPLLNPFQYDNEGRELTILSDVYEMEVSNPLSIIDNFSANTNNTNFLANLGLEGSVNENLSVSSNFSFTYNVMKETLFMPNQGMEMYYDDEAINVSKTANNDLNSIYNNTFLLFRKEIGRDHVITSNTGMHLQINQYEFDWGLAKNAHQNDEYRSIQDGQNNLREIGGENRNWNWVSFYEFLTYAYRDKYLLNATVSFDGSSRVGEDAINTTRFLGEPFGLFYSGGVAWRASKEFFLQNFSWLEELKFRATYGKTGNDDIGESSATNYYESVKFRETVGLYPALIPNDDLSYEEVTKLNLGVDISFFANRFYSSFNLFTSTTDNMLIFTPLDAYLGYDFRMENGGKMENRGWELSSFLRVVDGHSFDWDIQVNVSAVENEILEIKGNQLFTDIEGAHLVNQVGSSLNSFYGFIYKGVYSTHQEAEEAGLVNDRNIPYSGGDAIYEDLSGPAGMPDGVINDFDKTIIGSSIPELFGGISTRFIYKRWSLSAMAYFTKGNEVFNYLRFKNESMSGLENQSSEALKRWQYNGQVTDVPRAAWDDPVGNADFSTRWIEDGSYLRLKNITLSYLIPNDFLTLFRNAEFYVSANNILQLSNYLGYDPEFAYSYSHRHLGVDYGQMPQNRQFIAGIKLGF
jgi:TonB-linked SusC/RagA family outer membrane protein